MQSTAADNPPVWETAELQAQQKLAAINKREVTAHGADYLAILTIEIYEQMIAARQISSIYEQRRRA